MLRSAHEPVLHAQYSPSKLCRTVVVPYTRTIGGAFKKQTLVLPPQTPTSFIWLRPGFWDSKSSPVMFMCSQG